MKQDTIEVVDDRFKDLVLSRENTMNLASVLSDIQEVISNKEASGKLNLVKGVLFGRVEIEDIDGFCWRFKNKNSNSRFCDKCGLLRVGEYSECNCDGVE